MNGNTIILGGGLTGLSAAYHGGFTVYEKNDKCGGACSSPVIEGYTFDLGIHVLHTKHRYVLDLLQEDLKVNFVEHKRLAIIYMYGCFIQYPFQANTFGLPISMVKECLISYIKAYCKKNERVNRIFHNYEDWVIATFGKGIAKYFMCPHAEKFWTVPAKELTTDWIDVRIPMPSLDEVVEGALTKQEKGFGPNAEFRYPVKSGISAITDAFVDHCANIHLNKDAINIDVNNKKIIFADGTIETFDTLISTIPIPELIRIANVPDHITKAAGKLRYNSILCINLGIDRDKINDNHWIYYPGSDVSFFRISLLHNFSPYMTPKGKSSISAEVSYSANRPVNKDKIVDTVVNDLIKAKVIRKDDRIEVS